MSSKILNSRIEGKGVPLLILHGFLGMLDNWKSLGMRYAEAGFQVHLIDLRNHGQSFWSDDFNYDLLAGDLERYMDHHNLSRGMVLGHSMGGKTAMQFACDHPHRVLKLMVADIGPKFYPPHHQPIIDALNAMDAEAFTSRSKADVELQKYLSDLGTRQFLLKNLYWIEKGKLAFRFNLKILSEKMGEIGENIDPTDHFDGPTLFLRGDRSEYIAPGEFAEFKKHFPDAVLETIEKAGHWLHAENPEQFFQKSMAFLKE